MPDYPDIKVEIAIDYGLTDIVAQRYDAGVRSGEQVAKDMIAVRIGPDMRMAVVGAPSYFTKRPEPMSPQDLIQHNCINLRLPTWRLVRLEVREGWPRGEGASRRSAHLSTDLPRCSAARAGFGLAYVPEDMVQHDLPGPLKRVLTDWCRPFSGYHLYYPSRRQASAAFALLVNALRYRG